MLALHVRFHYFGLIHLISLNKYVVHKIINQGLSCLTYFMIVSKLITLCSNRSQGIIPLAISILCYANKDLCGVNKMQFVQVSSILDTNLSCTIALHFQDTALGPVYDSIM